MLCDIPAILFYKILIIRSRQIACIIVNFQEPNICLYETHAFAARNLEAESSIDAALSYMEIGDEMLSKKHFDIAVAQSNVELSEYPKSRDLHIYNHAEVLLMANRPEEVIALFMTEDPKVLSYQPANRDYLETAAKLMIKPAAYKTLKSDYINRIAKNGKVKDWSYLRFNRWLKVSNRSIEEQQHLHELETLND